MQLASPVLRWNQQPLWGFAYIWTWNFPPRIHWKLITWITLRPRLSDLKCHDLKTKKPFETGIDPINNRSLLNFWMNPQTSRCPLIIILNSTWKILTFYSSNHYNTLDKILNKFHQFDLTHKGQYQQFCSSRCWVTISESILQMTCDDIKWTAQ